jgi:hypothetical protein
MFYIPRDAANTKPLTPPVFPSKVYPYFDNLQVWLLKPVDKATLAKLRKLCGKGGLHVHDHPARFDARYRQRLQFKQPSVKALLWIASRNDALINRMEIALDFIFDSWADYHDAFEFLYENIVRRWHGKNQKVKLVSKLKGQRKLEVVDDICSSGQATFYDGPRSARSKIVFYKNMYSRITGELHCLHLEWRVNGLEALQRWEFRQEGIY